MFADNHATEAVPEKELVSGFRIALVYVGVAITLPAFLVAAEVFSGLGLIRGAITLGVTGAVLFAVASATMVIGARTRRSTYAIVQHVFGRWPAIGVNLLLALVMLGWFAVTVSLFADALSGALFNIFGWSPATGVLKATGSVVMIALTLYGFKAIDQLSRFVVPLLAIVLVWAFVRTVSAHGLETLAAFEPSGGQISTIGMGVSILVGAFMAGVTIVPDIARFARSPSQAVLASLLSFGLATQLVFFFAGVPSLATGDKEFVANLISVGFGWPALFVVIFATITTNINNLYSVSLGVRQVLKQTKDYQITLATGLGGMISALAGIENAFIPFLIFLGVAIPPVAGVYIADFFTGDRVDDDSPTPAIKWLALCAWVVGSAIAYGGSEGYWKLSGAPAVDGLFLSGLTYFLVAMALLRFGDKKHGTE